MIPPAWREADSATGPVAQGGTGHETSDLGGRAQRPQRRAPRPGRCGLWQWRAGRAMTLNGGWVSYGGDAKIELAAGLLAVAGGAAYAGIRLRRPIRAVRPPASVVILMFSLWVVALLAFVVGLAVYVQQFVRSEERRV